MSEEHGIEQLGPRADLGEVRCTARGLAADGAGAELGAVAGAFVLTLSREIPEPDLISAGSRFWSLHAEDLARAEAEFGVPPEVILGVLGVETNFSGAIRARFVQSTRWRRSPSTACAARNTSVMN